MRERAAQVFAEAPAVATLLPDVEPLYAAIGRLQLENALLNAESMSVAQQRALVAQANPASSVQTRCQALGLSRSSFYYPPCGEIAYNLES
ncbi:MAG: hypothetical protein EOO63_00830 [Hymenobacter sp.]|nr:MAG: hypothetical protein EOO63_00830 [Hymenobacter sp.]